MFDFFHKNDKLDSHNSPEEPQGQEASVVDQRAIWEQQIGLSKPSETVPSQVKREYDESSTIALDQQ